MSKKNNEVDGLFVTLFGPLILKIVSPLDPHSLIARRNPGQLDVTNLDCDWSVGVEIVGCKEWGKHQHSQSWILWHTQYLKLPHHQVEYVHNILYSLT